MKTLKTAACLILALAAASPSAGAGPAPFVLSSPTVTPGGMLSLAQVLDANGCQGLNQSPALSWQGAPRGTRSFAVTFYDPDAPTGSGWWHWVVFNIPATAQGLAAGAGKARARKLPGGAVQGRTDFGTPGFGGACPPPGDRPHRYVFTVYALRVGAIAAGPESSAAQVGYLVHQNELARASIEARYGRR